MFAQAREGLKKFLQSKDAKDDWKKKHGFKDWKTDYNEVVKLLDDGRFDKSDGKSVKTAWTDLSSVLGDDPWKSLYNSDSDYKKYADKLKNTWDTFTSADKNSEKSGTDYLGGNKIASGNGWSPAISMRIDIKTNFNDTWYKRKFKSGFLNKVIDTVKTSIHSHADVTKDNDEFRNKKFSADQMEPGDKRKLDSLQWKMTNKVAKDFISMLLGWSRKKQYVRDGDNIKPLQEELTPDEAFGKEMAKKALDNRGILGRLKQKLFAGGQSNNVISVCF